MKRGLIVLVWLSFCVSFLAGFVAGSLNESQLYRAESVKRGFAEYDTRTGDWVWRESVE